MDDSTVRWYVVTSAVQSATWKAFDSGAINTLGVGAMAAFNAVGKIEDFALVPGRSISNAMMTFTAQNDGAKKNKAN